MLEIRELGKTYGAGAGATHAIGSVSFTIDPGELVCVVGPSGCGKTTLLKCVAGLLRPTSGEVILRGRRVTGPPEEMALVFQEYSRSLMPWASVRDNVLLPLRHKDLTKRQRNALVEEALGAVGLVRFMDRYPWQLSGGMQQRVAIARALVNSPSILLADEPTGNLDSQTSEEIMKVFEELASHGQTVIMVTHEADIAAHARRVVVLRDELVSTDDRREAFVERHEVA